MTNQRISKSLITHYLSLITQLTSRLIARKEKIMLEAILSKYLLNALLLSLVSIGYSFLKNRLGEDRASTIKEAILSAMLWAEEELGIGNGSQKWEIAWKKLIEILADKNISLRKSEEKTVKTMMEANVGKINQQTYDVLLKKKLIKDKTMVQQSLPTK
jgi:hypothetical protein